LTGFAPKIFLLLAQLLEGIISLSIPSTKILKTNSNPQNKGQKLLQDLPNLPKRILMFQCSHKHLLPLLKTTGQSFFLFIKQCT